MAKAIKESNEKEADKEQSDSEGFEPTDTNDDSAKA